MASSTASCVSGVVADETSPRDATTPELKSPSRPKRGAQFWLVFLAICVSLYQAGFELCAVAIALPTISSDLNSENFAWVGSAYALASASSVPLTGGLAQAFGRRPTMLGALAVFAVGSAICGGATNMTMLITGRAVQGFGGGAILALAQIIVSDMVSLRERGTFNGLLGITWSVAVVTSSLTSGKLAERGAWRWIFYLNVPVGAFAFALVAIFLRTRTPRDNLRAKLGKLDWIGNFLVIGGTTAICVAITDAGVKHPWASVQVLVPLFIGWIALFGFFFYEARVAKHPLVPFHLLSNRTSILGYLATFLTNMVTIIAVYYYPVYLQGVKGDTPIQSGGLDWVGVSVSVAPIGVVAGVTVTLTRKYRPAIWVGFILQIVGLTLVSCLPLYPSLAVTIVYPMIAGFGFGILLTTTYFPVLAPLPVTSNARALAFFTFCRVFAQIWSLTIGATVLQNQLQRRLPASFVAQLPPGVQITYSAIPIIDTLPTAELQAEVREAFRLSLSVLWRVMVGFSILGLITSLFMKEVPMHSYTDDDWGVEEPPAGALPSKTIERGNSFLLEPR